MRNIMIVAGLLALAGVPAAAQENAPTNGRSVATLARIPLKSRTGAPISFGSRVAAGKPTLVAIWASWCAPCYAEAPWLNRIRKAAGTSLNFVYVNRREGDPDPNQPAPAIARFLAYGGMSDVDYVIADAVAFRQMLGPDVATIPDGLVGIPRIYLFDRRGRQIYTSYGFEDADGPGLERLVKEAVAP